MGRGGVEPPTYHFSGDRSYQLSYLPKRLEEYNRPRVPTESAQVVGGGDAGSSSADLGFGSAGEGGPMLYDASASALVGGQAPIV